MDKLPLFLDCNLITLPTQSKISALIIHENIKQYQAGFRFN